MCIRKENETTRMLFYNQYTFSYRSVVSRGIAQALEVDWKVEQALEVDREVGQALEVDREVRRKP
jgi:hypothetical protein